jgi:predicted MFS family arabinose efflux permease
VALLFFMFLLFEVSVVVLLPLATEVLPQARGTMMSSYTTAFVAGNAVGVLLGGWMFRAGGLHFNGIVALALSLSAVLLIWRFVADDGTQSAIDQPEVR